MKCPIYFDPLKLLLCLLRISIKVFFPTHVTVLHTIYSYTEKSGLDGNTSGMYSGDGLNFGQNIG